MALAGLACYSRQPVRGILALALGAFVTLWQVPASGLSGGQSTPQRVAVTGIYPRWALIVPAIFRTSLSTFVGVGVSLQFPGGRAARGAQRRASAVSPSTKACSMRLADTGSCVRSSWAKSCTPYSWISQRSSASAAGGGSSGSSRARSAA